ncbi:MAG TPA: AAA family ATPase, partial [Pyrinomonadaceae bacterium]
MTQLIIAGLVLLCLLSVGVIAYLARSLAHLRRTLEERERRELRPTPDATPAQNAAQIETALQDATQTAATLETGETLETTPTGESATVTDIFPPIGDEGAAAEPPATTAATGDAGGANVVDETNVYSLAAAMDAHYQQTSRPVDLRQHEYFRRGVELLRDGIHSTRDLIEIGRGSNVVVACIALEALAARSSDAPDAVEPLLAHINEFYYWPGYYALRALDARAGDRPVLVPLLLAIKGAWGDYTPLQSLREFVVSRAARGEREATFGDALHTLPTDQIELLTTVFDDLKDVLPEGLVKEFEGWKEARVDLEFLRSFGRVWAFDAANTAAAGDADAPEGVLMLEEVRERVLEMETAIRKEPPRSVLLVGDSGVGKTALVRVLARRLQRERWIILEASAADVMAGQQYIGQLEGRVQTLVREIGGKRVLWVVPNFHELVWAGRHQYNPSGLLDLLLPHVESGAVKLIGETTSVAYEKLMQMRPKLRTSLETCRVGALGDAETLEVARRWAVAAGPRAAQAAEGHGDATR